MLDETFVNVTSSEDAETMELPVEIDGTVLLTTIQAQFPTAIGLKYRSSTGGWRGVRAHDAGAVLDPPQDGWGDKVFIVTESGVLKRKAEVQRESEEVKKSKLLEDLIVLGLPYSATQEDLHKYFTDNCGELQTCLLKTDRSTGKSRGFGFIRFKTPEASETAMKGRHEIEGRRLVIRMAQRKGDTPTKLFVGRLPTTVTEEEVNDYFSSFGMVVDCFLPKPFRGFAFITYADQDDAKTVLRMSHSIQGSHLNVSAAESKSERLQQKESSSPYDDMKSSLSSTYRNKTTLESLRMGTGYDPRSTYNEQQQGGRDNNRNNNNDIVSDLKGMLQTLINQRRR